VVDLVLLIQQLCVQLDTIVLKVLVLSMKLYILQLLAIMLLLAQSFNNLVLEASISLLLFKEVV